MTGVMTSFAFEMPIAVVSEANLRDNRFVHSRRVRQQRELAGKYCKMRLGRREWPGRYRIVLTRLKGYRQRDYDDDNLRPAFKAVRDGIAQYLAIDDGSKRLTWEYRQEKGGKPGVRVFIEERDAEHGAT